MCRNIATRLRVIVILDILQQSEVYFAAYNKNTTTYIAKDYNKKVIVQCADI